MNILNFERKIKSPFMIYADFKSILVPISSMIEESKYCSDVMKKHFKKELVMTKVNNGDFKSSTKYWICENDYINNDVKVRDNRHITEI